MSLVDYNSTSESENEQEHLQCCESSTSSSSRYYRKLFTGKLDQDSKPVNSSKMHRSIKISIPSLNDFSDDEETEVKIKSKQLFDSASLLTLLPLPKRKFLSNTSFVPNILNKKARTSTTLQQKSTTTKIKDDQELYSDDDSEIPETFDEEIWKKVCKKQKIYEISFVQEYKTCSLQKHTNIVQLAPEVHKPYVGLNNKAFQDIVKQKQELKKRGKVIHEHGDEIRPEKAQWLKSLTDPRYEPKTTIQDPVNNTCKMKNHITALAQKALANDQELQLKWSENRYNRRLTQAKYGF
ncbi:hypothetical protein ILUMI_24929 [Ignelater luminosus]|uniref:Uncharacterized protein n=1 Tax=Ignelater luminosus TaxID=2038154 RepID=A0A8K0G0I4_IGNLU|nr:hypothetical protein ILUMI_24929 [Ignelater luminosus]